MDEKCTIKPFRMAGGLVGTKATIAAMLTTFALPNDLAQARDTASGPQNGIFG